MYILSNMSKCIYVSKWDNFFKFFIINVKEELVCAF